MLKKFVQQGRRRVETGGVSQGYVEDFDELRTQLADFFSILLLDIWNLPINRRHPGIGKVSIDVREAPASEKLSN